jgi:hypothetical protein
MFKYASSKPSKKKIKGIYTGESEWAERVSTRCFHLTTHSQLLIWICYGYANARRILNKTSVLFR